MLPSSKQTQEVPRKQNAWTGDCWKAWVKLRSLRSDLTMCVVNTDHGCGIIKFGKQKTINLDKELTYENFVQNKNEWMNIISLENFIRNI